MPFFGGISWTSTWNMTGIYYVNNVVAVTH